MHNFFIKSQKSMPLFSPFLLEQLFVKGYANFIVKLFVLMHDALKRHKESKTQVSDYIDMDLAELLTELQQSADAFVLASGGGQVQAASTKKKPAFSAFDAFDESS
jgi:tRNA pseudouridine-54 N-methylase